MEKQEIELFINIIINKVKDIGLSMNDDLIFKKSDIISHLDYLKLHLNEIYDMGKLAQKSLVDKVELFNTLFKEGTKLIVIDDFGVKHERILESKAWIMSGTAVAKFSDIGIYNLDRVSLNKKYTP